MSTQKPKRVHVHIQLDKDNFEALRTLSFATHKTRDTILNEILGYALSSIIETEVANNSNIAQEYKARLEALSKYFEEKEWKKRNENSN